MHPPPTITHDEALREIANSPATLEFRDLALDPQAAVYRSGGGLILVDARDRLVCAAGAVLAGDFDAIVRKRKLDCELLADRTAWQVLGERYAFERAVIHTLDGPWRRGPSDVAGLVIRPLTAADPLDHLPRELYDEIAVVRDDAVIHAGFVEDRAVSFAYCASSTETWSDISIDTLAEHRRRGVGAALASTLVDTIVAGGTLPVWGAVESNVASLRLAEKLGFTRFAGERFVHEA